MWGSSRLAIVCGALTVLKDPKLVSPPGKPHLRRLRQSDLEKLSRTTGQKATWRSGGTCKYCKPEQRGTMKDYPWTSGPVQLFRDTVLRHLEIFCG